MRYWCGLLLVALVTPGLVTAKPQPWDIETALKKIDGITLDKLPQQIVLKDVGDIWSDCGGAGDIGKIEQVNIDPDPPQKGTDLTVSADVTLSEGVSSGNLVVKLQYYFLGFPVSVIDDTYDLCGTETGLTCPLAEGTHNVKFENEIPSTAPGGKYTGSAVATSSGGKQILCINLEFNL